MNALVDLLNTAWAHRMGWALVHFLWEGAAIAGLLRLALRVAVRRTPQVRYVIGCMALVLMVAAPVVTYRVVRLPDTPTVWQAKIAPIFAEGKNTAVGLRVDFGRLPVDLNRLGPEHFRITEQKHPLTGNISDMFEMCPAADRMVEFRFRPGVRDFGPGNAVTLDADASFPLLHGGKLDAPLSLTCSSRRLSSSRPRPVL